jgi:hypothetical protein
MAYIFQIENNIPIPSLRSKYADTLKKMDVGDSVICETKSQCEGMKYAARRLGIEVTIRTLSDKRVRLWRTK